MAAVAIDVGGRQYSINCRDGGEDHLRAVAARVDAKAREAAAAVGHVNEARQLLLAALLLADENAASPPAPDIDLARLADRLEAIADSLEAER